VTRAAFDAVLFDCDGVLVDSEPITNGLLREMLGELGWVLTSEECMRLFIGKALQDEAAVIEQHTGVPMTPAWLETFRLRRNAALERDLLEVPGAQAAVRAVSAALEGRVACASGADRAKVRLQLGKIGLLDAFEGRIFSGMETPRSKPAPDVYLAAAAGLCGGRGHRHRRSRRGHRRSDGLRLQPRLSRSRDGRGAPRGRRVHGLRRHGRPPGAVSRVAVLPAAVSARSVGRAPNA